MSTDLPSPTAAPELLRGTIDGAQCHLCPFAVDGKPERPVMGIGIAKPHFVVIGEGPGQTEARVGTPLVGPTGQLFNRALRETGVDRNNLFLDNATSCLPFKGATDKHRHEAAACCHPRLERLLAEFPGRPVLALGGVAAKAVLGDATSLPITEIAGAHFEIATDDTGVRSVIPTIHPAAILRASGDTEKGPEKTGGHVSDLGFWSLKWDILKVKALGEGRDIRLRMRLGEEVFVELESPDRVRTLLQERFAIVRETKRISIDLETYVEDDQRNNALQAFIAKIRLLGVAAGGVSVCVAWLLIDDEMFDEFARILADETITKVWHNGSTYDRGVLMNQWYGFEIKGPEEDTLLQQHDAFPGAKKKLQHVASQFYAVEPWKSEFRDSGDSLLDEAIYCAKDTLATDKANYPLTLWIKKQKVDRVYDVDRVKAYVSALMHHVGYYVDRDVNAEMGRRLRTVIDSATTSMMERYEQHRDRVHRVLAAERAKVQRKGDAHLGYAARVDLRLAELVADMASSRKNKFEFDPANDNHAVALLKALGVQLWQTTKTGKTASGASILEGLASTHPVVQELIDLRSNLQLDETFVRRMFEWVQGSSGKWKPPHVQDDGRCHPLWSPTQISGRFGSKNPASSNWSMGDETHKDPRKRLPNTRRQKVAPPGRGFVAFDKCLAKGTLVDTPCGRRPIEELEAGDLVFSYDSGAQRPACARIAAKKYTGMRKTIVVVLDNGARVRCTPDHRWVTNREHLIYARDLQPGTRLLPMRRARRKDGYVLLYARSSFEYTLEHRAVQSAVIGRPITNEEHVHHADENPSNNHPDNLILRYASEHISEHARVNTAKQWCDLVVRRRMCDGISASIAARGGYYGVRNPNYGKRRGGVDTACPNCGAPTRLGGKRPKVFCTRTCYDTFRVNNPRRRGEPLTDLNHKVVEIIDDGLVVPTYDIEVERDHVFALAAGVFVHNSQLEARTITVQSGDPFLCRIFREGLDIHHEFGVLVFPQMAHLDKKSEEYEKWRNLTKRVEYGAIYGGSDTTVHKAISADDPRLAGSDGLRMVSKAIKAMKDQIGGVFAWQARLLREVSAPPHIMRSYLLGRMRIFPLGSPPPTDIANNPNQFTGADIMDEGLCRLMPRLAKYRNAWPIGHEHDAMYFECDEDDMLPLARDVNEAFYTEVTAVNGDVIPFPSDVKIGFAYNVEPSDKQKIEHPQLVWDCGRPGLKKVKL